MVDLLDKLLGDVVDFVFDVELDLVQLAPDALVFDEFLLVPGFEDQVGVVRELVAVLLEVGDLVHDLLQVVLDARNVGQEVDLHLAGLPLGRDLDEDARLLLGPVAADRLLQLLHRALHGVRNGPEQVHVDVFDVRLPLFSDAFGQFVLDVVAVFRDFVEAV